jgi:translation initiation factor 2 alpha subunit (eIF-2alpha)
MQEEESVLCSVERIERNTVFVRLIDGKQGTIAISEIAPGRIRNIRDYVVPNKKIVCKILRMSGTNIELSLRRVAAKERDEIMERYKQELSTKSALKQILKEKTDEVLQNMQKEISLADFIVKAKEDEKIISKYIPKDYIELVSKIFQKKIKEVEVKKTLNLKCLESDGMSRIKKILALDNDKIQITYIAAGKFVITITAEDYKKANHQMDAFIAEIEKKAKQNSCEFESI